MTTQPYHFVSATEIRVVSKERHANNVAIHVGVEADGATYNYSTGGQTTAQGMRDILAAMTAAMAHGDALFARQEANKSLGAGEVVTVERWGEVFAGTVVSVPICSQVFGGWSVEVEYVLDGEAERRYMPLYTILRQPAQSI